MEEDGLEFMFGDDISSEDIIDTLKTKLVNERADHKAEVLLYEDKLSGFISELQRTQLMLREAKQLCRQYESKLGIKHHHRRESSLIINDMMGIDGSGVDEDLLTSTEEDTDNERPHRCGSSVERARAMSSTRHRASTGYHSDGSSSPPSVIKTAKPTKRRPSVELAQEEHEKDRKLLPETRFVSILDSKQLSSDINSIIPEDHVYNPEEKIPFEEEEEQKSQERKNGTIIRSGKGHKSKTRSISKKVNGRMSLSSASKIIVDQEELVRSKLKVVMETAKALDAMRQMILDINNAAKHTLSQTTTASTTDLTKKKPL